MNIKRYKEYLEEGQKKDSGLFSTADKVRKQGISFAKLLLNARTISESMRERLWSAMKVWINTMRIYHYGLP